MATAVIDLDFDNLPNKVTGLINYDRALVLIRIDGIPIGQSLLSVTDGKIGTDELKKELMEGANWSFWRYWLSHYLELEDNMASDSKSVASATVAVCTRDRPEELGRCLDGLLKMPDNGQEILVVDSCSSTDATLRLLESYSGIRYIREDRPGLNIARNRALREAKHPIVAFIDDDAVPDAQWLRSLIRNFDDPLALCVTGLTMPIELETQAQEYFEKEGGLGRGFLRMVFDAAECYPHEAGNAGVGTNMAVRSSILGLIGPFDEALDVGTATRAGGDVELLFRILSSGYRVVYEPSALNWHRHKKSWVDTRRLAYGYRVGEFSAWTRSFLFDRELEAAKAAWKWLISHLANPGEKPLDLYLLGLFGCLVGPWIYLYSRWRNRRSRQV